MLHKNLADSFFVLGAVAVLAAAFGWAVQDMWLASTQWLEIGIIFFLVAIYTRLSEEDDLKIMQARAKKQPKRRGRKKRSVRKK